MDMTQPMGVSERYRCHLWPPVYITSLLRRAGVVSICGWVFSESPVESMNGRPTTTREHTRLILPIAIDNSII